MRDLAGYPGATRDELVTAVPAAPLRGYVLNYRGFRLAGSRRRREVPAGAASLVLLFDGTLRLSRVADPKTVRSYTSLVSGVDTSATLGEHLGVFGIEVAFSPLGAYTVFAVPMVELACDFVDLACVLGRQAGHLASRLSECPDWGSRFAVLDMVLADRLAAGPAPCPQVRWAWRALCASAAPIRPATLAAELGWSVRHLERRFEQQVGVPPRAVGQIARLQRALRLQEQGLSWAQVAAMAGFYDQPHFHRTFQTMIGCTPAEFRADRAMTAPEVPVDRVPGQITSVVLPG